MPVFIWLAHTNISINREIKMRRLTEEQVFRISALKYIRPSALRGGTLSQLIKLRSGIFRKSSRLNRHYGACATHMRESFSFDPEVKRNKERNKDIAWRKMCWLKKENRNWFFFRVLNRTCLDFLHPCHWLLLCHNSLWTISLPVRKQRLRIVHPRCNLSYSLTGAVPF